MGGAGTLAVGGGARAVVLQDKKKGFETEVGGGVEIKAVMLRIQGFGCRIPKPGNGEACVIYCRKRRPGAGQSGKVLEKSTQKKKMTES